MKRLLCALLLVAAALLVSCGNSEKTTGQKVLILGIDGMDPQLLQKFMDRGLMPNMKKVIESGSFLTLKSSTPPQSPIAWSNFITGQNPGKHGIYDFIHRHIAALTPDAKNPTPDYTPYLSTTLTEEPDEKMSFALGNRVVWLAGGKVSLLRQGTPFWEYLARAGIKDRVFRIPSNFPPAEGQGWSSSGMGTPDMMGSYGNFTFYTDAPPEHAKEIYGGTIVPVYIINDMAETELAGPPNTFALDEQKPYSGAGDHQRRNYAESKIPFTIYVDAQNPAVKIELQGRELLLAEGEWSGWVPVKFPMWPHVVEPRAIVRFYLKQVRPDFKLYASPVNMDPLEPPLPISNPAEYISELAADNGYFYTQGMPENTKARQADLDILNDRELYDQMMIVHEEDLKNYRWHLDRFDDGLLFFYFGSLDLGTHMFWRLHDWTHPAFDPNSFIDNGDLLEAVYRRMDKVVGMALDRLDDRTTLIIMSDHGFAPWNRSFQVNSWLLANGYLVLQPGVKQEDVEYFTADGETVVDWSRTQAYNIGINGLYINEQGRECFGAVAAGDKRALIDEIAQKLEAYVDPQTGEHPVLKAYKAYEVYSGAQAKNAPDIVIGYRRGYRGGDESALGGMPKALIDVNTSSWSGDHCMATEEVPGIIASNKKITKPAPALIDIGPTVLKIFGLPVPADMDGKPLF